MSRAKQQERVLNALKDPKGVSPWYAVKHLGNLRLAATINQLRRKGHVISSEKEKGKNIFGETISYTRYKMVKENV